MRARRKEHSASRISLDYSRCETPIAAYDERARKNGYKHKMRRIGLLKCLADVKRRKGELRARRGESQIMDWSPDFGLLLEGLRWGEIKWSIYGPESPYISGLLKSG